MMLCIGKLHGRTVWARTDSKRRCAQPVPSGRISKRCNHAWSDSVLAVAALMETVMPSTSLPNNGASIGRGTSDSRSAAPVATDSSVSEAAWTRASQVAVVGLFVIALVWCAYVAQHIIVPLLLAWTIATVVLPVAKWLQERGVPSVLASIVVTVLLLCLIIALLLLLSAPLAYWLGRASYIGALLKEKLESFNEPL